MDRDSPSRSWLTAVTIVVLVAAPNLWVTLTVPAAFESATLYVWWGLYAVYVAAFAACVGWALPRQGTVTAVLLLAAQTFAALGANWLIPTLIAGVATGGALLVVIASQLARLPMAVAVPWVVGQHTVLLIIYLNAWPTPVALVAGIAFAAFSFVVMAMERLSLREQRLRLTLERTLAELTAARQCLEDRARDAERLRISRDLHDLLGHHLVALSLQLQLAERSDPQFARGCLARASSLTRLLLADLRAVVADLREQPPVDLVEALNALSDRRGAPRVEIRAPLSGRPSDSVVAETVLRAAQELVTNARKHAQAGEIRVQLGEGELLVEDDGVGGPIAPGTGIRGLHERLDAIGGSLVIEHPGRGTRARVRFPVLRPSEVRR